MSAAAYDPALMRRRLAEIGAEPVAPSLKGVPPGFRGRLSELASSGASLLAGDLPMPTALLKRSALDANRAWMRRFLAHSGAKIAPHGKTTMAPHLLEMQLEDGAWGITAATAQQAALFAEFGVRRIIIANQLVGEANIALVCGLLRDLPALDLYCLVDSLDGVRLLEDGVRRRAPGRPLQLLVEIGAAGGRTGARSIEDASALARAVSERAPTLALRGVEAYEGVFGGVDPTEKERRVRALLADLETLAARCEAAGFFADGPVVLTAGGSEFFDLAARLAGGSGDRERVAVIRSGCYLTHDDLAYARAFRQLLARSPDLAALDPGLTPALEVWAAIQSRPEPGLAFATLGKRDISFDFEMPAALRWFRPGAHDHPLPMPEGCRVLRLNDQHAFLEVPNTSAIAVGDLVGFGVSHACTTFDKWRTLLLVDDDYGVTGAVRTFF